MPLAKFPILRHLFDQEKLGQGTLRFEKQKFFTLPDKGALKTIRDDNKVKKNNNLKELYSQRKEIKHIKK